MLKNSDYFGSNGGARSFMRRLAAEKQRRSSDVSDHWELLRHHSNEFKSSLSKKNLEASPAAPKVTHQQYKISEDEVDDGHYTVDDYESQGRVEFDLKTGFKALFLKSSPPPEYPPIRRRVFDLDSCSITPEPSSTISLRSSISSISTLASIDLNLSETDFETCDEDDGIDMGGTAEDIEREVGKVKCQVMVTASQIETIKEEFQSLSKEFKEWGSKHALHTVSIRRLSKGLQDIFHRKVQPSPTSAPPTTPDNESQHDCDDSRDGCATPTMLNHEINDDIMGQMASSGEEFSVDK